MTTNDQTKPTHRGHGLFDVLPTIEDPLPEGRWFFTDETLHCIEVEGEKVRLYTASNLRLLVFYPLFVAWAILRFCGVGLILTVLGVKGPPVEFREWIRDYPAFWGFNTEFPRESFIGILCSEEYQEYLRRVQSQYDALSIRNFYYKPEALVLISRGAILLII